ncbi:ABC transporter permease [Methanoregula formicica]|uniref:ABC-type transport system, involved in lipoprotein release, permease component n=1 Tax=Methanoregula formicica (strain DSM 22288 / NBRC 105244 / SMSP) TaxID=593750 RepID=L0HE31_METFS|nr:ABC transporter permease [Methanoregula formicica]AGB01578.1 ABC-type transport system, involved in lipoprotein release, permease component [Methanoregula formicica SMSP]
MGKKELRVAFLLALRSLQRGSRSSVLLTILIIGMCFTNMIFLPGLFNGIGQSITKQVVDYEIGNVLVSPKSGERYISDMDATLDLINGMPGVERATPHFSKGATLTYRKRVLGATVRAIRPNDEKLISPLYTKMVAGSYLGDADTGEVIIGKPLAGDASVKEEDEFQASLGGVRVGDSITMDYGNGYVKDYRVKGIFYTGWYQSDTAVYVSYTDMALADPRAADNAEYITVKIKPGYSEKFVKDELQQYGVSEKVQTTADLLEKSMGRALQSFAIINMVSLIVGIIITTVVLFIVITIKTINSRRQIGILKAIGVDKEVIMHNYGFQVVIMSVLGILFGLVLTLLMAAYLAAHPIVTPEWSATLYLTPWDLVQNSLILFAASLVAGYVPAYQVSREDIQSAMRA